MRRTLAALLVVLLAIGLGPSVALAQRSGTPVASAPPSDGQAQASPARPTASAGAPDIDALGVSFDRIKRLLADRAPSGTKSALKLNYYVEVMALAPTIQLFTREDVAPGRGVIPWGAPTHGDIVSLLTPVEFRSPRVPVSALVIQSIIKLAQWDAARVARYKAEQERLRVNEEERRRQKALEESGLVVAKPVK
jgi:hypothetical protein